MPMNWGMMGGAGEDLDAHFIEMMIPHHEGAIEMAEVALERSNRPEVRLLAEGIIEAQSREIADMRTWYEDWYGAEVPDYADYMRGGMGMMGGADHMFGDTDELSRVSDEEFDRVFLQMMIPHHQMALAMTAGLLSESERPEMRQLADNIQTSQSAEIEVMRGWLQDWY
jgi:uncharacterized protein (DUF305 family)